MAHQFMTLVEIAQRIREGLLTAEAFKNFVSYSRCAEYPDIERFHEERGFIEKTWPAYADDLSLSRPPAWAKTYTGPSQEDTLSPMSGIYNLECIWNGME